MSSCYRLSQNLIINRIEDCSLCFNLLFLCIQLLHIRDNIVSMCIFDLFNKIIMNYVHITNLNCDVTYLFMAINLGKLVGKNLLGHKNYISLMASYDVHIVKIY